MVGDVVLLLFVNDWGAIGKSAIPVSRCVIDTFSFLFPYTWNDIRALFKRIEGSRYASLRDPGIKSISCFMTKEGISSK